MQRRTLLLATMALFATGHAVAQVHIRPDPNPRLPPQPGQGLPLEERRFLRDAAALSAAQVEAATGWTGAGGDEEARGLAANLARRHRELREKLRGLAQARGLQPDQALPEAEALSHPRVAEALRQLRSARAASPRDFLAAQSEVHAVLVELYQTEASNSPDRELGRFAIVSLVGIQEDFAAVVRLGERHGLARPDRLANPPQYGPGAGPPR